MRNKTIDVLKSIAIIAVVIGHIICILYPTTFEQNNIFKLCYSFHMPLFVFLSGFVIRQGSVTQKYCLINRSIRLLTPWLIWTFIVVLRELSFSNYLYSLFVHPAYWFLINNWICFLILFISLTIPFPTSINIISLYAFTLLIYHFHKSEVLHAIQVYLPFYMLGFVIRQIRDSNSVVYTKLKKLSMICLILYPLSIFFYAYGSIGFENQFNTIVKLFNFDNKIFSKLIKLAISTYSLWIVPTMGIGFYSTL